MEIKHGKNYMADVAKLLGVELGEVFKIDYDMPWATDSRYVLGKFTYDGFEVIKTNLLSYPKQVDREDILSDLLIGAATISSKPWKPKKCGEIYLYVDKNGDTWTAPWYDCEIDVLRYKLGNCYRTRKEAEANRDKWIDFYVSDEVIEV